MAPSDRAAHESTDLSTAEPSSPPPNMIAHISMRGDVPGHAGEWLGDPASPHAVEAIMLAPAAEGPPHLNPAPEYQLLLADGLMTPWTPSGRPCGSGGYGLPALGLRFRLTAETASFFDCRYDVAFTDGSRLENVPSTEMARAPSGAPVSALRLSITPRPGVPLIVLNDIDVTRPIPWVAPDRPDDPTIRLRLLSPAFETKPPQIRNGLLIPPDSWAAMNVSFGRGVFPPRTVTLRQIDEALIVGGGLVFDRNLDFVPISDQRVTEGELAAGRAAARQARSGNVRRVEGMSLFCRTQAPANYGHWLVEGFATAWVGHQLLGRQAPTYIVQNSPLIGVIQDAMRGVGINPFAVSIFDETPIRCASLIILDGLTDHGIYQSPLCVAALRRLADPVPPAPPHKLFVRRDAQLRPLTNQAEIEARLQARGFLVVDPARMSLWEQIALFKGATMVVGPLGAALTNIAFCPEGTRVVALTSQSFPDTFFWFIAQHRGLTYEEVRGSDVGGQADGAQAWDPGFTLSDADLAYLDTL
jgi:hypothetical protein